MAKRVALGRRISTSTDRGLMISGLNTSSGAGSSASPYAGADVTATTNNKGSAPHSFDSQEHSAGGLHVFYYTQFTITGGGGTASINHYWGRDLNITDNNARPAYALRWSFSTDISSGIAQRCYPPAIYNGSTDEYDEDNDETIEYQVDDGISIDLSSSTKNTLVVENPQAADSTNSGTASNDTKYCALVVFFEDNTLGGESL
jgi:hypothetical protein